MGASEPAHLVPEVLRESVLRVHRENTMHSDSAADRRDALWSVICALVDEFGGDIRIPPEAGTDPDGCLVQFLRMLRVRLHPDRVWNRDDPHTATAAFRILSDSLAFLTDQQATVPLRYSDWLHASLRLKKGHFVAEDDGWRVALVDRIKADLREWAGSLPAHAVEHPPEFSWEKIATAVGGRRWRKLMASVFPMEGNLTVMHLDRGSRGAGVAVYTSLEYRPEGRECKEIPLFLYPGALLNHFRRKVRELDEVRRHDATRITQADLEMIRRQHTELLELYTGGSGVGTLPHHLQQEYDRVVAVGSLAHAREGVTTPLMRDLALVVRRNKPFAEPAALAWCDLGHRAAVAAVSAGDVAAAACSRPGAFARAPFRATGATTSFLSASLHLLAGASGWVEHLLGALRAGTLAQTRTPVALALAETFDHLLHAGGRLGESGRWAEVSHQPVRAVHWLRGPAPYLAEMEPLVFMQWLLARSATELHPDRGTREAGETFSLRVR
eukprot:gene4740-6353_t